MKKTIKRSALVIGAASFLALPASAFAVGGIIGDCSDCHTMHNSQQGQPVAITGTSGTISATPIQNLLKMDCVACHASPDATGPYLTLTGGSVVPQVSQPTDENLAGGNFRYSTENQRHGHNVKDLTAANGDNTDFGAPPGMVIAHSDTDLHAHRWDADYGEAGPGNPADTTTFGAFTCAGARGCHGTRAQVLPGGSGDWDNNAATANTYNLNYRRTGIAAISGAHHNNYDGYKPGTDYVGEAPHSGAIVADGYRFIPGLKGMGNTDAANRWKNVDANSHNEYYGDASDRLATAGSGGHVSCGNCHEEGLEAGISGRAATTSYLKVPGNDMTGFCSTCHGTFHSSGDVDDNGTSGAFLRHPSDWVIPASGEYQYYTSYDVTAPVARPDLTSASTISASVRPGTDEVMCLSCHEAHATQYDYMLRFDYTTMEAGGYATEADAKAAGGCQACHTTKGVLPENRDHRNGQAGS
jgi:hypothetical protein